MFGAKPWDTAREVLNNPTIPRFYFKGLGLEDSDFITLRDLIELEKKEVYAKLLRLRDISNSMIDKDSYIDGVQYSEDGEPRLNLLLSYMSENDFKVSKYTKVGKSSYPSYSINEDVLNYLLENKNLKSKLDMMLVSDYLEELTAFKEALTDGTFYANYQLKDTSGTFDISVEHDGYHVEEVRDSIIIPDDFGKVVASREYSGGYRLWYTFRCSNGGAEYSTNIDKTGNIRNADSVLYLHKKLLPEIVQAKLK